MQGRIIKHKYNGLMRYISIFLSLVFVFALGVSGSAQAQTTGMMPVLYNSSGQAVNSSTSTTTALPAGTYYLQPGSSQPVNYLGNGIYYNPATQSYGGSVYNQNGQAGSYTVPASTGSMGTTGTSVGIPNTGAGGDVFTTWLALLFSALAIAGGVSYFARSRYADFE